MLNNNIDMIKDYHRVLKSIASKYPGLSTIQVCLDRIGSII
jgi:hypothetical protein